VSILIENEPLSEVALLDIFKADPNMPNRIVTRESSTIEFKENYNHSGMADYFKTIASFANNKGGYIVFGVKDKPRTIIGLTERSAKQFDEINVEVFTGNLCDFFSPAIEWEHILYNWNNLFFGIIYIYELNCKPCICKKSSDLNNQNCALKEGEIYYRYRGRSERIHYPELIQILQEQRQKESLAWMKHFERILRSGPTNIATLDLNHMDLDLNNGKGFVLDKDLANELLSKVKLIKSGKFTETGGKPTLKLIGNLTIPEEIPVPDVDLNISYPFILRDLVEQLSLNQMEVKALLWKYRLSGDRRYNLAFFTNIKNEYPNQKYSKYAIDFLKEKLYSEISAERLLEIKKEYMSKLKNPT
jgi:hypothetical protein